MKFQITFSIELSDDKNGASVFTKTSWDRLRRIVKRRSNSICYYCGRLDKQGHVDHKIPLSRGGTDEITNLVWSCSSCNTSKGDRTDKEFIPVDYDNSLDTDMPNDDGRWIESKSGIEVQKSDLYFILQKQVGDNPIGFSCRTLAQEGISRDQWSGCIEILSDIGLITKPSSGKTPELTCDAMVSVNLLAEWVGDDPVYKDKEIETFIQNEDESVKENCEEIDSDAELMRLSHELFLDGCKISRSALQRNLSIGYNRAARVFDKLIRDRVLVQSDDGSLELNRDYACTVS